MPSVEVFGVEMRSFHMCSRDSRAGSRSIIVPSPFMMTRQLLVRIRLPRRRLAAPRTGPQAILLQNCNGRFNKDIRDFRR